jgi:hypothetical protein
MEQPNEKTFKSPLKKQKNKREKLLVVRKVSTSTKTQAAKAKTRVTMLKLGK